MAEKTYTIVNAETNKGKNFVEYEVSENGKKIGNVYRYTYEHDASWSTFKKYSEYVKAAFTFKDEVMIPANAVGKILIGVGVTSAAVTHWLDSAAFDDHIRAGTAPTAVPFVKRKLTQAERVAMAKHGAGLTPQAVVDLFNKLTLEAKDGVVTAIDFERAVHGLAKPAALPNA